MIAHANVLFLQFDLPIEFAVADSLVFNMAFMGFGLLYWYIVQYVSPDTQGIAIATVNQALAVIVGVSFLTYLCNSALASFAIQNSTITTFLDMAVPFRIFLGSFFLGMVTMLEKYLA